MRRLERSFPWLRKAFLLLPVNDEPLVLPAGISLTSDVFGTEQYVGQVENTASGNVGVAAVATPSVPDNLVDLVVAAHLRHNDPLARLARLAITRGGVIVTAIAAGSIAVGGSVVSPRAFFLAPGWTITGVTDAIAAGSTLTIDWVSVRLPLGEYLQR